MSDNFDEYAELFDDLSDSEDEEVTSYSFGCSPAENYLCTILVSGLENATFIQHNDGHAEVIRAEYQGRDVIVKTGDVDETDVKHEYDMYSEVTIDHENVIAPIAIFKTASLVSVIYPDLGFDLAQVMENVGGSRGFPVDLVKHIFSQVMKGIEHLHNFGLVHTDIKHTNIFIDPRANVKIGDLGNALKMVNGKVDLQGTKEWTTINYRPFDILMGNKDFGFGMDIWSAGCLLAFLATGRDLFPANTPAGMVREITTGLGYPLERERMELFPSKYSVFCRKNVRCEIEIKKLGREGNKTLNGMLMYLEKDRLSATQVLESGFF